MYGRRSSAEVSFCALILCLACASYAAVNGQAQTTPPTSNRAAPPGGQPATQPGTQPATQPVPQPGTQPATQPVTQPPINWAELPAADLDAKAQTFPRISQLRSNVLPGGESIAVEVEAAIKPNSLFYAKFVDDPGRILEAVWNAEQPDQKESVTRVRLRIPDLGISWRRQTRELVLVALSRAAGSDALTPDVAVRQQVKITSRWFCGGVSILYVVFAYGLAVVAAGWNKGKYSLSPVYLTTERHGKTSLSRFQIFFFTLLVFGLLVFIFLRTGVLSDISPDILLLLGISAAGATGSAVTDSMKTRLSFENWSWLRNYKWLTVYEKGAFQTDDPNLARWRDLLKTNEDFDIYKFQLVIVSIVVGAGLLGSDLMSLSKFTIPPNLLGLLGLSNAVYIAGKAVGTSFAELNDTVAKLRAAEKEWVSKGVTSVVAIGSPPNQNTLDAAKEAAPEQYKTYILLAREAARMLQAIYGMDGTKFKTADISDAELMPQFP